MKHKKVYEKFKKHFSMYIGQIKTWVPNGENCILLTFKNDRQYTFTCKENEVRFESVKGDGAMKC